MVLSELPSDAHQPIREQYSNHVTHAHQSEQSVLMSELPSELLLRIIRHLPLSDLLQLRMTSSYFRAVSHDKFVWRMLARRDFGVNISCSHPREIYQQFYHRYGRIIGLYRLYTFFSKHLLQIVIDPRNCRHILFRTWPLDTARVQGHRDVLRVCFDKKSEVSAECLEGHQEDNQTFCFNDHSTDNLHYFNFHYCKKNLYFSPLKGDPFKVTFCSEDQCQAPDFTQVVCCQKLLELENPANSTPRVVAPGVFLRYPHNPNSTSQETFFTLSYLTDEVGVPYLALAELSTHHKVCCASMLMSCDLANVRRSVLTIETPNYDLDMIVGRPFSWAHDIQEAGGIAWPKLYKAAYFDGANMVFLVLFDSCTVGCFFADGTCDLFERFRFT